MWNVSFNPYVNRKFSCKWVGSQKQKTTTMTSFYLPCQNSTITIYTINIRYCIIIVAKCVCVRCLLLVAGPRKDGSLIFIANGITILGQVVEIDAFVTQVPEF